MKNAELKAILLGLGLYFKSYSVQNIEEGSIIWVKADWIKAPNLDTSEASRKTLADKLEQAIEADFDNFVSVNFKTVLESEIELSYLV